MQVIQQRSSKITRCTAKPLLKKSSMKVQNRKQDCRCFYFTIPVEACLSSLSYSAFLSNKHSLIKYDDIKLQFRYPITKEKQFRGMLER